MREIARKLVVRGSEKSRSISRWWFLRYLNENPGNRSLILLGHFTLRRSLSFDDNQWIITLSTFNYDPDEDLNKSPVVLWFTLSWYKF